MSGSGVFISNVFYGCYPSWIALHASLQWMVLDAHILSLKILLRIPEWFLNILVRLPSSPPPPLPLPTCSHCTHRLIIIGLKCGEGAGGAEIQEIDMASFLFGAPKKVQLGSASKCVTTDVSEVWRDQRCVISTQKDCKGYKFASFQ